MNAAGDGAFQSLYDEVFIAEGWRATEGAAQTTYLPYELGGRHIATRGEPSALACAITY